jgi:hypothetical protein
VGLQPNYSALLPSKLELGVLHPELMSSAAADQVLLMLQNLAVCTEPVADARFRASSHQDSRGYSPRSPSLGVAGAWFPDPVVSGLGCAEHKRCRIEPFLPAPRLCSSAHPVAALAASRLTPSACLALVTAAMDARTQSRADNHFYPMLGAISTEPVKSYGLLRPCQAFMGLCENFRRR